MFPSHDRIFEAVRTNRFTPFTISDKMKQTYEDLAKEKNIPNPLNRSVEKKIDVIIRKLDKGQKINKPFIIKEDDFVATAPQLPNNTAVVQNPQPVIPQQKTNVIPQTGLTQTETALLSPEEQIIRQRTRT